MYSTPQRTPTPAPQSRTAQFIVSGVVILVIVGWFFRDLNLVTKIENMMWEVKKVTTGEVELYMEEGIANHQKGDYQAAITSFSKIIVLEPENGSAYNGRAKAYCMMENESKCRADIDKAIELEPDTAQHYFDRPYMMFQAMNREDVYADLNKAIELMPDYHSARLFRAMLYEEDEKWEEALTDYTSAIAAMPDDTPQNMIYHMYVGQAQGLIHKGMYPEAIASYDKLFELTPEFTYLLQEKEAEWRLLLEELEPGSKPYNQLQELIMKIQ